MTTASKLPVIPTRRGFEVVVAPTHEDRRGVTRTARRDPNGTTDAPELAKLQVGFSFGCDSGRRGGAHWDER